MKDLYFIWTVNFNQSTAVGDYINTMKTAFDFNFDLHQNCYKQHGYK